MRLLREDPWRPLERAIGHRFRDRKLLETALTHASYRVEQGGAGADNQRLEFLGDAVLGVLAAESLFAAHGALDEGGLSVLRSQATSGKTLAAAARRLGLGPRLRMGRGELLAGGAERDGALADALEAIIGAVWLDGGLKAARKTYAALATQPDETQPLNVWADNPKGRLQEYAQHHHRTVPVYALCDESGPAHRPSYRVRVSVGEALSAEGEGPTKRAAEADAAGRLLARYVGIGGGVSSPKSP
jgi:ribonuclease-3